MSGNGSLRQRLEALEAEVARLKAKKRYLRNITLIKLCRKKGNIEASVY